ncbi:MAG: hypothetical protein ACREQY_02015 [Candidatus Binatia bacterium]
MSRSSRAVQASAARAAELMPGSLEIGRSVLHISPKAAGAEPRFAARFEVGSRRGTATVELRTVSRGKSEVVVSLEPATIFDRMLPGRSLRRVGDRFAEALRYEIETRAAEESDAFAARRTSAELVRQRGA